MTLCTRAGGLAVGVDVQGLWIRGATQTAAGREDPICGLTAQLVTTS